MKNLKNIYENIDLYRKKYNPDIVLEELKFQIYSGDFVGIGARPGNMRHLFLPYFINELYEQGVKKQLVIENQNPAITLFNSLYSVIFKKAKNSSISSKLPDNIVKHPLLGSQQCLVHEHIGSWEQLKPKLIKMIQEQQTEFLYINSIHQLFLKNSPKGNSKASKIILQELKEMSEKYQFTTVFTFDILESAELKYPSRPSHDDVPKFLKNNSTSYILLYHPAYYLGTDISSKKIKTLEAHIYPSFDLFHHQFPIELEICDSYSYLKRYYSNF